MVQAVNLMSDRRIFRGSVAARIREEAAKRAEKECQERTEKRYRTEVIRNRLSVLIPPNNDTKSSFQKQIISIHTVAEETKRINNKHKLARLAGPLQRLYKPQIRLQQFRNVKGNTFSPSVLPSAVKKPTKRTVHQNQDQCPFQKLPLINAKNNTKMLEVKNKFENVRFVPHAKGSISSITPVMPLLPKVHKFSSEVPVLLPSECKPEKPVYPTNISDPFPQLRRHTQSSWTNFPSPTDPPPSINEPSDLVETSAQTEEEMAFEDIFAPFISSMVSMAITDAIHSLEEEDAIKMLEVQNNELLNEIEKQNLTNLELQKLVEQHTESEKKLEAQKRFAEFQLQTFQSHSEASDMVGELVNKSLTELLKRNMVHDERGHHSVAADTRQLERQIEYSNKAAAEIRTDFFPYVYARAERVFVEQLAGTYLKDALFARDSKRRNDAKNLLNSQIHDYSQFTEKKKIF